MSYESLAVKYPAYEALFQEIQARIEAFGLDAASLEAFANERIARIMPKADHPEAMRCIQKYLEWKQTTI